MRKVGVGASLLRGWLVLVADPDQEADGTPAGIQVRSVRARQAPIAASKAA
jgi:hypothetical protein